MKKIKHTIIIEFILFGIHCLEDKSYIEFSVCEFSDNIGLNRALFKFRYSEWDDMKSLDLHFFFLRFSQISNSTTVKRTFS